MWRRKKKPRVIEIEPALADVVAEMLPATIETDEYDALPDKAFARYVEVRDRTVYCYAGGMALAWRVREKPHDMQCQECREVVIETGDNPNVARITVHWQRGLVVVYHGIRRVDLIDENAKVT